MLKPRTLFTLVFVVVSVALWTACGGNTASHNHGAQDKTEAATDDAKKQGKEYTSAYICPMHCEGSGSDQPGKCPVCEMDYVANESQDHEGHQH